jgi:hypothetical protein
MVKDGTRPRIAMPRGRRGARRDSNDESTHLGEISQRWIGRAIKKSSPFIKRRFSLQLQPTVDHAQSRAIHAADARSSIVTQYKRRQKCARLDFFGMSHCFRVAHVGHFALPSETGSSRALACESSCCYPSVYEPPRLTRKAVAYPV